MSDRADPRERNVVAVLAERGLIAQMTESGLPEAAADRQLYGLLRLRSDSPQPAYRQPRSRDGAGALPAPRPPAHSRGRRWHRHDRRPQRQIRGAQTAYP